ncbi:MAG: VTT domain-containing protein [Candidatus Micrarchaeia archaeon]
MAANGEKNGGAQPVFGAGSALSLAGALAITALAVFSFSQFGELRQLGYPGVFLISLISSATVLFPMPGFAVVFAMGAYLNPVLVGIAAGLGSGIGEISGYLAGYAGHGAVERTHIYKAHKKQIEKYGAPAIFVLAFIPNPAFDVAGIAAGALKMKWWKFLLAATAGKVLRYVLLAYSGSFAVQWF